MAHKDKIPSTSNQPEQASRQSSVSTRRKVIIAISGLLVLALIIWFLILNVGSKGKQLAEFSINEEVRKIVKISGPPGTEIQLAQLAAEASNPSWAISSKNGEVDTLIYNQPQLSFSLPFAGEYEVRLEVLDENNEASSQNKTIVFSLSADYQRSVQEQIAEALENLILFPSDADRRKALMDLVKDPRVEVTQAAEDGEILQEQPLEAFLNTPPDKSKDIRSVEVEIDDRGEILKIAITWADEAAPLPPIAEKAPSNKKKTQPPARSESDARSEKNDSGITNNTQKDKSSTSKSESNGKEVVDNVPSSNKQSQKKVGEERSPVAAAPLISNSQLATQINDLNGLEATSNWDQTLKKIETLVSKNFANDCVYIRQTSSGRQFQLHKPFKNFLEEVAALYEEYEMIEILETTYGSDGKITKLVFLDPIN